MIFLSQDFFSSFGCGSIKKSAVVIQEMMLVFVLSYFCESWQTSHLCFIRKGRAKKDNIKNEIKLMEQVYCWEFGSPVLQHLLLSNLQRNWSQLSSACFGVNWLKFLLEEKQVYTVISTETETWWETTKLEQYHFKMLPVRYQTWPLPPYTP